MKKQYLLLALPLLSLACVGNADDPGVPSASWFAVTHDHTLDPRPATASTVKDMPGAGADDIVSESVADPRYDRFYARAGEPGLAYPKTPYDPANPAHPSQPESTPATRPATMN